MNTRNHICQGIWKYIRKYSVAMSHNTWGIGTNLTHRTTLFPAWLSHFEIWVKVGKAVSSWHVANQGKVWQTRPVKSIKLLNLLYSAPHFSTPFHTLPTLPQFALCNLCQSVFLVFHTLPHAQPVVMQVNALHSGNVGQLFINDTHCHAKSHRNSTPLHTPP